MLCPWLMHRPLLTPLFRVGPLVLGLVACSGKGALLHKADGYLADERYSAAARTYERVLEKRPGDPAALIGVASAWIGAGEPEKAIVPAQVAAEKRVRGADAVMARALLLTGRGVEGLPYAETALSDSPENAALVLLVGETHLAKADFTGAREKADAAVELKGGAAAYAFAAWMHGRTADCPGAISLAGHAATAAVTDAWVQAEAAAAFRLCGDTERASATSSAARALLPGGPGPLLAEADRILRGGDQEGGLRRYSALRAVYPEDGRFAAQIGRVWLHRKVYDRAAAELAYALALPPYAAIQATGGIQVADRRSDGLSPEERDKQVAQLWTDLADARLGMRDLRGVAEARQRAGEAANRKEPLVWFTIAESWDRAGDKAAAFAAARHAIELDNNFQPAHVLCMRLFAAAGDIDHAIGHGRLAWELNPGDVATTLLLAALYQRRNDVSEARQILSVTAERVPDNAAVREALKKLEP